MNACASSRAVVATWVRSAAACAALAVLLAVLPSTTQPAGAAGLLVVPRNPVVAAAGQSVGFTDLFQLVPTDIVSFTMVLTGGLTFPGGGQTSQGPGFPAGLSVIATSSGTALVRIVALRGGKPTTDEATTRIDVRVPALLVTSRGRIRATTGQTLPLSAFFSDAQSGAAGVRHTEITAYLDNDGLGVFPSGIASFRLDGQPLSQFLNAPVVVKRTGQIDIEVRAVVDGREFLDFATAYADVSASTTPPQVPSTTQPPVPVPVVTTPTAPSTSPPSSVPAATAAPSTAPVPTSAPSGNRAPTALAKSVVIKANTTVTITLKGTDPDGTRVSYAVVDFPQHGRLTGRAPNLRYTPDKGFTGIDAFTFIVSDGTSRSEEAAISITVTPAGKVVARKTTKKK